ncbi:hypothetical protein B4U79_00013 [Dinothrombium tinctorium]|uniref:Uncharacterized protein n=1 Tax=Dinothrombium tinctorium TaxID=1965070 RepID=A0A3S3PYN3_9ACAR|nr:hypothetical protein B4U79_00013 [Dinothrombium tinctorium]
MMKTRHNEEFNRYIQNIYDPLKVGSIDGSDKRPHDKAIVRAIDAEYKPNARVIGDPLNTVSLVFKQTPLKKPLDGFSPNTVKSNACD